MPNNQASQYNLEDLQASFTQPGSWNLPPPSTPTAKAKAKTTRPPCGHIEHAELYVQMNQAHAFCTGCKRMMIRRDDSFKMFATPPIFQATADQNMQSDPDLLDSLDSEDYDEIEEDYDDE